MIRQPDVDRIANEAQLAIDSLTGIANHYGNTCLAENYLQEKVEMVQRCINFMKGFL